jgi:SAM-dependent methyltransferase
MKAKIIVFLKKIYSIIIKIRTMFLIKIEKIRGIDFTKESSIEELGLSDEFSHSYENAGTLRVKIMLSSLSISKNDLMIDIGCGKGKMIYLMSKFPFKRVDGVEISERLSRIAIKNLQKLNVTNAEIFTCGARLFRDIDKYNFIYFYNPFPSVVMKVVIKNIEESLMKIPRSLTIVYFNPVCHSDIIESGIFKIVKNKWKVSIYKNR